MSESLFDKSLELSTNYEPSYDCINYALDNGIDERMQRLKFIAYYREKGQGSSNWNIVYMKWLRNCINYMKGKAGKIAGGANKIISAYQKMLENDPLKTPAIVHQSECDHYIHPDYQSLPRNRANHPIWPQINMHSKNFDKKLFNARKLYLLTIPDGKERGLEPMDLYDRTRFIYEVTSGQGTSHYVPDLSILSSITI